MWAYDQSFVSRNYWRVSNIEFNTQGSVRSNIGLFNFSGFFGRKSAVGYFQSKLVFLLKFIFPYFVFKTFGKKAKNNVKTQYCQKIPRKSPILDLTPRQRIFYGVTLSVDIYATSQPFLRLNESLTLKLFVTYEVVYLVEVIFVMTRIRKSSTDTRFSASFATTSKRMGFQFLKKLSMISYTTQKTFTFQMALLSVRLIIYL